jgi:hypothetical protein
VPTTGNYGFEYESPSSLPGVSLTGGPGGSNPILAVQVDAALTAVEASLNALEVSGYRYLATQVFTATGSFTKGSYSGIRAVRVHVQGGGGQCGGTAASGVSQSVEGGGGGGGGYSESFILAAALAASETVTVGSGGSAGAAGAPGAIGGTSSFGAFLSASGGNGGVAGSASGGNAVVDGGQGGSGASGNIINLTGGTGAAGLVIGGVAMRGNAGGTSRYGTGTATGATDTNGQVGNNYGGGGGGTRSGSSQAARVGAAGAPGLVIVEVFV